MYMKHVFNFNSETLRYGYHRPAFKTLWTPPCLMLRTTARDEECPHRTGSWSQTTSPGDGQEILWDARAHAASLTV